MMSKEGRAPLMFPVTEGPSILLGGSNILFGGKKSAWLAAGFPRHQRNCKKDKRGLGSRPSAIGQTLHLEGRQLVQAHPLIVQAQQHGRILPHLASMHMVSRARRLPFLQLPRQEQSKADLSHSSSMCLLGGQIFRDAFGCSA